MLGIFRDRYRARRASQKIQVIDVVSRACYYRVIAAVNQDCVAIPGFQSAIARALIEIARSQSAPGPPRPA